MMATLIRAMSTGIAVIGLSLLMSSAAYVYTGGPALVEVLGWDSDSMRVYIHEHPPGGTLAFGDVYYFDLDGADPETRVRTKWNNPHSMQDDPEQIRRLRELRERLQPLWPSVATSFPKTTRITEVDSVDTPWGSRARYERAVMYEIGQSFRVISYGPTVIVKNIYKLPEEGGYLFVFVLRGNVYDSMFAETQVPVIVRPPYDRVRHVEWIGRW